MSGLSRWGVSHLEDALTDCERMLERIGGNRCDESAITWYELWQEKHALKRDLARFGGETEDAAAGPVEGAGSRQLWTHTLGPGSGGHVPTPNEDGDAGGIATCTCGAPIVLKPFDVEGAGG